MRMSRIGHYARVTVTAVAGLYAIAFMVFNARRSAEVWLFIGADLKEAPTFVVIAVTAALSIGLSWLLRQLLGWRARRYARGRGDRAGGAGSSEKR